VRVFLTVLAVAIVALLTAALVAPLFVDWSAHRGEIEARLGEISGGRVALSGPVTLRLLPVPYLEVGEGSAAGQGPGEPRLSFRSARLELALVKLASGAIRFTEIRLEKPVLTLRRGANGSLDLPFAPAREAAAIGFDRLIARDGTIRIEDASGAPAWTTGGVELDADAPSLAGPYHASGQFAGPDGAPVAFRLVSEEADAAGTPIRAAVEAGPGWPAVELDGVFAHAGAAEVPSFSGSAVLTGTVRGPDGPLPWRAAGRMSADLDQTRLEGAEFRFGPEERGLRAEGGAALTYAARARLAISARAKQANVDALLRRKGEDGVPPARALSLIADALGPALARADALTLKADFSASDVILGSQTLSDFSARLEAAPGTPLKTRFDIALPGQSRLKADGALETGSAAKFTGAVDFSSDDFPLLRDWASQGAPDFAAKAEALGEAFAVRAASLSGEIEASKVGLSGRSLRITLDRSTLTGALAFTSPVGSDPGRLYMDLSSDSLDVGTLPTVNAGAALLGDLDLSVSLRAKALHVGHVGEGEIDSGSMALKVERSGPKTKLDRLTVADLGGASVDVQGSIDHDGLTATGHLRADRLRDFALLIARLAPGDWSRALAERAPLLSPTSLSFEARGAESSGEPRLASLKASGTIAHTQATLTLDPRPKGEGQVVILDLDAPDAAALMRQLSPSSSAGQSGRAHIGIYAAGAWGAGYDVEAAGTLAGADVSARGRIAPTAEGDEARLFGSVKLKTLNAAPLASAFGLAAAGGTIGPIEAATDVTLRGERWSLTRLSATVAGVKANGEFAYEPPAKAVDAALASPDLALAEEAVSGPAGVAPGPHPAVVTGELSLDRLSLPALFALALGPPQPAKPGELWSDAKFAAAPLSPPPVAVRINAAALDSADGFQARGFSANLSLDKGQLDLADMAMKIADGAASGRAALRRDRDNATLSGTMTFERIPVSWAGLYGRIGGTIEFASTGRSAAALISGLAGSGSAEFSGAELPRSDPAALDRVVAKAQAPDAKLDETNIAYEFGQELDKAKLELPGASAPVSLTTGTIKFGPLALLRPRGDATFSATLDLARLSLETQLALTARSADLKFWSGPPPSATVTVEDALSAPKREVEVAGLAAGLATQAIARESDRIGGLEADIRERAFFNRRLKGERFMDRRNAEIADWRAEQARLKGLAERAEAEKAAAEKAAADRAAEERAVAEKAAEDKTAAETAAAQKAAAERAAARAAADQAAAEAAKSEAKPFPQPELPPEVSGEPLPAAKPPLRPSRLKPRSAQERAAPADPTAGGLY
jgi:uncharacterized protein involved in outer membrane biogenesis